MWRKHQSVYQDHMKYNINDIFKPFKINIICYADRLINMNDLSKYLPPPLMKGESAEAANWTVHNQELMVREIRLETQDRLPSSIQNELE